MRPLRPPPLTCRTFGPPVRFGATDLAPCRLCFVGATAAEVDACRVTPDPDGIEDRLILRSSTPSTAAQETLIAFVVAE